MIFTFKIGDGGKMFEADEHSSLSDAHKHVGETLSYYDIKSWERDMSYSFWVSDYEEDKLPYKNSKWVVDFNLLKERNEFPTIWPERNEFFIEAMDRIKKEKRNEKINEIIY